MFDSEEKLEEILLEVRKHNDILGRMEPSIMTEGKFKNHEEWIEFSVHLGCFEIRTNFSKDNPKEWLIDFLLGKGKEDTLSWLRKKWGREITFYI